VISHAFGALRDGVGAERMSPMVGSLVRINGDPSDFSDQINCNSFL
jgi:hypothetical protein